MCINSVECSSFGGLFKIAITSARNEFLKDPVNGSLEGYSRILGTGKLAHAALLPLSSSNERDALLENRYFRLYSYFIIHIAIYISYTVSS